MWASTHNESLKQKMSSLVDALKECQDKMGTGYLSAFPSELFDRFEAIQPVWAPYYTIHKIMAGLLDQYTFSGNSQSLIMLNWMVDYFVNRVQDVIAKYSIERHWMLIRSRKVSDRDELYREIGTFFMDIVNTTHAYATGGTSVSEFCRADPKRLGNNLQTENEESCTTYNMLKVSRNPFIWTREIIYVDYYERALTKKASAGIMIYMLPLGHGVSKAVSYHGWGTKNDSFWCYGTGNESFSKLGDSIYFEEGGNAPGLYIIQYIATLLIGHLERFH